MGTYKYLFAKFSFLRMPPKKPSGAQYRKLRETRKEKHRSLSNKLNTWIAKTSKSSELDELSQPISSIGQGKVPT